MELYEQPQEEKSGGAVFGSVMIILILIIGGIYLVKEKIKADNELKAQQEQLRNQIQNSEEIVQ